MLHRVLARHVVRLTWQDAVKLSGRQPASRDRPTRGPDPRIIRIHDRGFKTIRDLSEATGVPHWTIRRMEGKHIPPFRHVEGIKVVGEEEYEDVAGVLRDLAN